MTFKGHLTSGVVVGVGVAVCSVQYGYIDGADFHTQAAVAATALFFALFPDLDTSSLPQRWFFRLVFSGMLILGWTERYELATLVGIVSLLPLLDHHRGWTHWRISPLVVSLLLGATYEYWRARIAIVGEFDWANVRTLVEGHWLFLCACIVGWYTHLLLDGRFKLFPTDQDHH